MSARRRPTQGGPESEPDPGATEMGGEDASLIRSEERLDVDTAGRDAGRVHARKSVESRHVQEDVARDVEHVETVDRLAPEPEDSGQIETLEDGSISIPVFEEELVVTKRLVVRERVIVRKAVVTEHQRVEADLRREQVDVEVDERRPDEAPADGGPRASVG